MFRKCLVFISCSLVLSTPLAAKTIKTTLDNGMTVIAKEDNRAPVVVTQLWYRIGSIDENVGKTGLSHVLEHMMFKGTHDVPAGDFSKRISAFGGQMNAYTSRDRTVYYQSFAAKHLPAVLKLEADRMVNLNFSDRDFVNEMEVVKEERRMRTDDTPSGVLWEAIYKEALQSPNESAPVIGWIDDLNNMKPDDARQWYKQWYSPNNATLVMVGDFKAENAIQEATAAFGGLSNLKTPGTRHPLNQDRHAGYKAIKVSAPSELPMLSLNYRVPHLDQLNNKEAYAYQILAAVLDGHSASRLEKNLVRQKQMAVSIGVGYDGMVRGEDLFTIIAMPAAGVSVEDLETAIKAQLQDIADNGIGKDELKRIHTQIDASYIYQQDSITSQASEMGALELLGFGHEAKDKIRKQLQNVSTKDVQAAAKNLTEDTLTRVLLEPKAINTANQATPVTKAKGK